MATVAAAIFDAYGTLLDVHSAMEAHAERIGPDWRQISQEWRVKQMEYAWVRTIAGVGHHRDFWRLTREALDHVAALHRIRDPDLLDGILGAYRRLDAYPEVPDALRALRREGVACAILSNGEPAMLGEAVGAAGLSGLLDDVLSVEAAGVYKPDERAYRLACARFRAAPGDLAFFSSNAWDVFGALSCGLRAFRVNRGGLPDEYGLRGQVAELADLSSLPERLR